MNDTITYATVSRDDCVPLSSDMFIGEPRKLLFDLEKSNYYFL